MKQQYDLFHIIDPLLDVQPK